MPCYLIREWFHTQVEVMSPRISLYSSAREICAMYVHIQACLFWFVPSHVMARSKLADPKLANFPAICTLHSYVRTGTKREIHRI